MSTTYNSRIITDGLVACYDATNPKSYSVNVHPAPLDIYSWAVKGVTVNCTISRDSTTPASPAGGIPVRAVITGNSAYISTYSSAGGYNWNLSPTSNTKTWCVSVYVKASTSTIGTLYLFGADNAGIVFNGGYYGLTAKSINITTEWTRQQHYITMANNAITNIQVRLDGPNTNGQNQILWWDGIQVERSQTATQFNPNTNANNSQYSSLITTNIGTLASNVSYNQESLSFDGTANSYCTITPALAANQQQYSISAWWKPTSNTSQSPIFEQNSTAFSNNTRISLVQSGTNWGFDATNNNAIYGTISYNQWMHSIITVDQFLPTNPVKLYQNGILIWQGDSTANVKNITLASDNSTIGNNKTLGGNYLGNIGQVAIYNRVLSADEVDQNFNALRGRYGL